MVSKISLDSVSLIKQSPGNIVSDMDGEKVILSIKNGKYYNLGEIGGEIWDLINNENTINSLVDILSLKYDVEKSVCEDEVKSFLDSLLQSNLIEINI